MARDDIDLATFMEKVNAISNDSLPDDPASNHAFATATHPAFPLMKARDYIAGKSGNTDKHIIQPLPITELRAALQLTEKKRTRDSPKETVTAALAVNLYLAYTTFVGKDLPDNEGCTLAIKQPFWDCPSRIHVKIHQFFDCSQLAVWSWLVQLGINPIDAREHIHRKNICHAWWKDRHIRNVLMAQMIAGLLPLGEPDRVHTKNKVQNKESTKDTAAAAAPAITHTADALPDLMATLADMCV